MSAKRELSSTLKNLKFMQRAVAAAHKVQEKAEVEVEAAAEVVTATDGAFGSSAQVRRKCIVIMEGNPHPGAVRGRMSFQNFNPEIDKLNGEARGDDQTESASPSDPQDIAKSVRGDGAPSSRFGDLDTSESISLNELKRKQPELEMETPPSRKLPKTTGQNAHRGSASSQSNGRGSHKSNKGEKYDFNNLRRKK